MPIVGMTTRVRPQFPSLGTIRKGAKRTAEDISKNRPGRDLEYFRFSNPERPELERAFQELYPREPQVIRFYFMYDSIEDNWDAWMEEWVAGGLVHRCDGETMVLWRTKTGDYLTERKECPYHQDPKLRTRKNPGCKQVGRLRILLPEMLRAGHVGDVTVLTSSIHDIMSIQACLEEAYKQRQAQGFGLRGIEFTLQRVKRRISTPSGDGKRARREKWLTIITPSVQWVQFQIASAERAQFAMLRSGMDAVDQMDDTDEEDVAEHQSVVLSKRPSISAAPEDIGPGPEEDDVEDAEFEEVEPGAAPPPQPSAPNDEAQGASEDPPAPGHKPERPADPRTVRGWLRTRAYETYKGQEAAPPEGLRGLVAGKISQAMGEEKKEGEQGRHLFLWFVFDKLSTRELMKSEVQAIADWLLIRGAPKDRDLNPYAAQELKAIIRAAQDLKGQQQMEIPAGHSMDDLERETAAQQELPLPT